LKISFSRVGKRAFQRKKQIPDVRRWFNMFVKKISFFDFFPRVNVYCDECLKISLRIFVCNSNV
jgi:hypothetical protein